MRFDRGRTALAAATVLLMTLSACGGDDDDPASSGGETQSEAPSATPSATPSGLTGDWTASPGQADEVQQALSAKGFECTRNADPAADLRVCSKGQLTGADSDFGGKQLSLANLRYLSDSQGTVVLAAIEKGGGRGTDKLVKAIAQAVLPADDAAVYQANGRNLGWGTVETGETDILTVKGWPPGESYVPAFEPLSTSKEKALPPLQAAELTCEFSETDEWGTPQSGLTCKDPAYKASNEDGSIEGATAELVLVDEGTGISRVRIEGRHSRTQAENARGVKQLLPRLASVDDDPSLAQAVTWIRSHLDGLPHSAYVGQWRVDVSVVVDGGLAGWPYTRVTLSHDKPNLGQKGAATPSRPTSPDESPEESPS